LQIITELNLPAHGFKYLPRDPSSFTPSLLNSDLKGKYLLLGRDDKATYDSIAQFSKKDADAFPLYEEFLGKIRELVDPLIDHAPPEPLNSVGSFYCKALLAIAFVFCTVILCRSCKIFSSAFFFFLINSVLSNAMNVQDNGWRNQKRTLSLMKKVMEVGIANRKQLVPFYELFTGPASHILDRWFESDILKTTLATDAVIGAMCSPTQVCPSLHIALCLMKCDGQVIKSYVYPSFFHVSN
jgi:phytoene dehydrogenase-like protein